MTYDRFNPEWRQKILLAFYYCENGVVTDKEWSSLITPYRTYKDFYENVIYLAEHGLLDISECPRSGSADDRDAGTPVALVPSWIRITHRGIDFLRADGGLGAILNVNVIKLHDDTLEALSSYVDRLNINEEDKNSLKEELKKLPVDGLRHVMTKAIDAALTNPSEILKVIYSAIS